MTSGQSFRWTKQGSGAWLGSDGDRWATVNPQGFWESNHSMEAWTGFWGRGSEEERNRLIAIDSRFESMLARWPGLWLLRPSDPVETIFSFICSANNNLPRITQMVARISQLGPKFEGIDQHRFPSADRIAEVSEQQWREFGFGYRAKSIPVVARALAQGGDACLTELKSADYRSAHSELLQLPGIGPKVADCICLYAFHHDEAAPIDTHFLSAYESMFGEVGGQLTTQRYRKVGDAMRDRFGELAGYAQLIMYFDRMRSVRSAIGRTI